METNNTEKRKTKKEERICTDRKENEFSSYIRKSRWERLQSHICLTASSYMAEYLRISSYILGSPFSNVTLQLLHPEFRYI